LKLPRLLHKQPLCRPWPGARLGFNCCHLTWSANAHVYGAVMNCLSLAENRKNFETAVVLLLLLLFGCARAQCPSQCDCEGTAVFCSSKGLTSIPSDIPEATTSLDLRSNQIGSIRDGLFSELKLESLTSLLLDNNQLTEISSGTFIGIPELTTLQLNGNQISVINDRAFAGLPHLTNLSA
jgi:hypothetical protein